MNKELNQKINGLNYDPNVILSFQGERASSFIPNVGKFKGSTYIVTRKEKRTVADGSADIAVIDAINDRTYPGALLLANRKLVENMPTALHIKRAPVTLRVNLPGLEEEGSVIVDNPTYSDVSAGIHKILNKWLDEKSEKYHNPSNCSYSETSVYSKDQLSVKLDCSVDVLSKKLNLDFESITKGEKSAFVLEFKQIFYTVAMNGPEEPAALFADDVTWDTITSQGVDDMNPPVYVANVAYGRTVYVGVETTKSSASLEAKLQLALKDNKLNADVLKESVFEDCKYTAMVIGGDADSHINVTTKDFAEIAKLINGGALFSASNPGVPISYTAVFVKHNEIAMISRKTEYIETISTEYASSKIELKHNGVYIAKFYVDWEETSFDENGNAQIPVKKSWPKNGDNLTKSFSTNFTLPGNATNIHVKATEKTGLVWEPWRTVVDEPVLNAPVITVSISGTTLHPHYSVDLSK